MMDFQDIYTQYSPRVYRVCMGYTNNEEQAKDLTQETFISVWQHLASFRQEAHISTWIFRIATNHCLRAIEKAKHSHTPELPEHLAEKKEESNEAKLNQLYQCIAQLEETDRIIISLLLEDLPQAEIAAIVGLSHANTRVKIHRIKEKLAVKMKGYEQS